MVSWLCVVSLRIQQGGIGPSGTSYTQTAHILLCFQFVWGCVQREFAPDDYFFCCCSCFSVSALCKVCFTVCLLLHRLEIVKVIHLPSLFLFLFFFYYYNDAFSHIYLQLFVGLKLFHHVGITLPSNNKRRDAFWSENISLELLSDLWGNPIHLMNAGEYNYCW